MWEFSIKAGKSSGNDYELGVPLSSCYMVPSQKEQCGKVHIATKRVSILHAAVHPAKCPHLRTF